MRVYINGSVVGADPSEIDRSWFDEDVQVSPANLEFLARDLRNVCDAWNAAWRQQRKCEKKRTSM